MADDDGELATTNGTEEKKRRRRRSGGKPSAPTALPDGTGPQPGMMKVLWADIRGRRLPRQPTADELAWEAEEEAAELEARGGVTGLSNDHYERLRQRSAPR